MGLFSDFPGEPWGDRLLEQDLEGMIESVRHTLKNRDDTEGYIEQQISGYGDTTQLLIVLEKGASMTDRPLDDSALSLSVLEGRIHVQSDEAHLHPEAGTNVFLPPGPPYEIQAVEPASVIATFMF
jgi:hypothetical protein